MKNRSFVSWREYVACLFLVCGQGWAASFPPVKLVQTPDGGIQPQAVVDGQGRMHVVYLKGDPYASDVFYVRREHGVFKKPIRVNSRPGSAIAVGTVRGAQIALGKGGRVHVAWNGSAKAEVRPGGGAPMVYTRLNEAASGFEPERNLMNCTGDLDGGGSVAADAEGNVYVVWHAHPLTVEASEQSRSVFVAKSTDDGRTFAAEARVNVERTGACGCCGLKAYVDRRGGVEILYRSATAVGTRDATLLVSNDRAESFRSTVLGPWRIGSCPMSTMEVGPGLDDSVYPMWETEGQVYAAKVSPGRLAEAVSVFAPAGSPGNRKHPASAIRGSYLLMAWTEGTGWEQGGSLGWECVDLGTHQKTSGRSNGVIPVWGRVAAGAIDDGFTIIY